MIPIASLLGVAETPPQLSALFLYSDLLQSELLGGARAGPLASHRLAHVDVGPCREKNSGRRKGSHPPCLGSHPSCLGGLGLSPGLGVGGNSNLSFSAGPLSPFSASFLRASLQSASTGPPGPYTILCLSTVSVSPPLVETLSKAQHVHRELSCRRGHRVTVGLVSRSSPGHLSISGMLV